MEHLSTEERQQFLADHPDWELDGETISRTFHFDDFVEAIGFVNKVAIAAEVADHHPDIDVRWNKVTLALSTHSEGALTSKDTALAARADALAG
jgi:4a-hydroxytetrahydrobiopterin dehydratase